MSINVNIDKIMGNFYLKTKFNADIGITAIFGPSGAGKSTLVNLIAGLMKPNNGYIKIFNELIFDSEQRINVPVNKRGIGFVFQDTYLYLCHNTYLQLDRSIEPFRTFAYKDLPYPPSECIFWCLLVVKLYIPFNPPLRVGGLS